MPTPDNDMLHILNAKSNVRDTMCVCVCVDAEWLHFIGNFVFCLLYNDPIRAVSIEMNKSSKQFHFNGNAKQTTPRNN